MKKDNILDAYNFFKNNIGKRKLDANIIIQKLMFVVVDLGAEEDEQQIFDTINSLGVRLTTAELLKNYFFNRDDLDFYNRNWKEVFEKGDDTRLYWEREFSAGRFWRTFIDMFFYSYLQIKIQDPNHKVSTKDKNEFSRVDSLFQSYKDFIKNYDIDKKCIIKEIKEYASIFRENFNYEIIERELTNEFGIERINAIIFGLENSTLIPYTLFVLKNVEDKGQRKELFKFIETYVMRRMVVKATTKNYNQLFTERMIGNKILSKPEFRNLIEKSDDQINYLPNDGELKKGFDESILINKQSKGILYFIESKIRNRDKQATQLLGINSYSVEHIMPKKWENNWGQLETHEEKNLRNKKLLTLGNLTIITQSLNASVRDSSWETKKMGSGKLGGLERYSAGIETLSHYLGELNWNGEQIEKRANDLYTKSVKIWSVE